MRSATHGLIAMLVVAAVVLLVLGVGWITRPTSVSVVPVDSDPAAVTSEVATAANLQIAELLAQQQAAHWSFVTLVLTGTGLVALFATLVETQLVGYHSRRIGEAQVRAYVGCEAAHLLIRDDKLEIVMELRNFGQSPAFVLWCEADIFIETEDESRMDNYRSVVGSEPSTLSAGQQEERRIPWWLCAPLRELPDYVGIEFLTAHPVIIKVVAKWIDVFDENQRATLTFRSEKDRHFVVRDNGQSVTRINLMKFQEELDLEQ